MKIILLSLLIELILTYNAGSAVSYAKNIVIITIEAITVIKGEVETVLTLYANV